MRGKFQLMTTVLGLIVGGAIAFGDLPKAYAQTSAGPGVVGIGAQVNVTPVNWWGGGYRGGYYRPYWYGPRYYSYYRPYYAPYYYSWYPRYYNSYYYPGAYLSYSYPTYGGWYY
jgi:hypothetical protein